jgi:uncharacterized membrane protein
MRRETKNEIIITVLVSLLIVGAAVYGLNSQNVATYNGPTLQTYNYNVSEVSSTNQTLSTVTNNGISALDILNASGTDNQFSSKSTGYYPGTFRKNITLKVNSTLM